MLDKTDLDQIQTMISESEARTNARIAESEARTNAKFDEMEARIDAKFAEQDKRIEAKFAEQEARIDAKFAEQQKDIMQNVHVLMESEFRPQFRLLTEMIQSVLDRLPDPEKEEETENRLQVLEATARRHSREIAALQRANRA